MLKERRAYERFITDGHVVLKPENDAARSIKADLYGISFLGASISAPEKIEQGSNVAFELTITLTDDILSGAGKIAYVNETTKDDEHLFNMGIEFVNINNKKIQHFLNLIQHDIIEKSRNKK